MSQCSHPWLAMLTLKSLLLVSTMNDVRLLLMFAGHPQKQPTAIQVL
jgi:hypothetical protein